MVGESYSGSEGNVTNDVNRVPDRQHQAPTIPSGFDVVRSKFSQDQLTPRRHFLPTAERSLRHQLPTNIPMMVQQEEALCFVDGLQDAPSDTQDALGPFPLKFSELNVLKSVPVEKSAKRKSFRAFQ